jgi:HEAT repeat protein
MIASRCLAVLVSLAVPFTGCTKKEEVAYGGKPLHAWIEMLKANDPYTRYAAVQAVGEIGPEAREAIPLLVETIRLSRNGDRRMLLACNNALLKMGREIVPHMITLLKDEEWEMRRGGAWILGKLGPEAADAVPALTEALKDPSPAVRQKAEESLQKIKGGAGTLDGFSPESTGHPTK